MSGPAFLKGAFVLSVAAFISKLLGLLYVIPLKHIAGDEGLALYQAVFPIYNTILILSVSGIPIALSKLISEKVSLGEYQEVPAITGTALRIMILVALVGFVVLFFGAGPIASWIGNSDTILSIQALAFAMLVVPFVAVLRGYFYGYQLMNLSALSQVIEQLSRVIVMIILVYWFMKIGEGMDVVTSGAALGSFAGVGMALVVLIVGYIRFRPKQAGKKGPVEGRYIWKILSIAIPVSLSTLMLPLLGLVDSLSVINLLTSSGVEDSTVQFGVYSRGVPIVQFAAFYANGLSVAVVPALTAARTMAEKTGQIRKTIEISFLIGVPASIGMMMIAHPLNVLFYGNDQGSDTLAVLAVSTMFLALAITTSGILQGLGRSTWPAIFLFLSVLIKVLGNVWLVPPYGIMGAAYSTILAYGVITLVSLIAIRYFHPSKQLFQLKDIVRWLFPSLFMGLIIYIGLLALDMLPFHGRMQALFILVGAVGLGLVSYVAGLLLFKVVSWNDLKNGKQILLRRRKKS